ncbi:MAG TPA: hypothetical protein VK856_08910 [Anaerolineaceae bacterium]|nr:hypothetical protein [Anaerolineaceae bacterium]
MAKQKFDGILEAVRVDEEGQLQIARIFERHGVIFSDRFLVDRDDFIKRIKGGKKFAMGVRQYKMGSLFTTGEQIQIVSSQGKDVVVVGTTSGDKDQLNSVPRF